MAFSMPEFSALAVISPNISNNSSNIVPPFLHFSQTQFGKSFGCRNGLLCCYAAPKQQKSGAPPATNSKNNRKNLIEDDFEIEKSGGGVESPESLYAALPLPKPPAGFVLDEQGKVLMASNKRIATIINTPALAMAYSALSTSLSNHLHHYHFLIVRNLTTTRIYSLSPIPTKPKPLLSSKSSTSTIKRNEILRVALGRRRMLNSISIVGFLLSLDQPFSVFSGAALASQVLLELGRYDDSKEGFTLLIPTSWIKVDKAGATVLFEDPDMKANNVGVVVSPTRISSLAEFGTPQFVADKLIQAERRKESTKEAEVISVSERSGHAGLTVYEVEYKVDSTRGGLKRVFSAAFVTSKKLYLLNITHSDASENPLNMERRTILEQVLHSFDSVPST